MTTMCGLLFRSTVPRSRIHISTRLFTTVAPEESRRKKWANKHLTLLNVSLSLSSSYQAIVIPWSSQCSFNCYSLTSLTYFGKGTDSDGYVAAEFPAHIIDDDRLKFALGDRLYYGEYYNAPLKQGKDYCIILRTVSEWNGVRTQSCVIWAQIKDLSSSPQHLTVVILGSIAAFCSILFLLFCIACAAVPTSPAELAKRLFFNKIGHLSTTISTNEQSAASSSSVIRLVCSNAHIYQSYGTGNAIRRGNQGLSSSS
ncbi:hypothetical protein JD844_009468 [Phrynosoma platyrhinos]|uniref:Receptor-type tyrosine-protein phosphatase U-like Fn3 domain-containing protein n=1 Tax=Phrynosoma platyrhinos TaxID=52577 RepID=A0ABQ7TFH5_PHRPL|nr:hypothetical protein JD844_009468 [Phrynosoma platyrhinos]